MTKKKKEQYEKLIKKEYKDCQTCFAWHNGLTMKDCFAKHNYNEKIGCGYWVDAKKLNYTTVDIIKGKVIDPTKTKEYCDDLDLNEEQF